MLKKILVVFAVLLILIIICLPMIAKIAEKKFNKTLQLPPYQSSNQAITLHNSLVITDLHADPLLWNRDLNKQETYGHLDIPRMTKGNLGLQVFGIVTQSPKGQNFKSNSAETDRLTPLMIVQNWPLKTWSSFFERAIYQTEKLKKFAQESNGQISLIVTKSELTQWQLDYSTKPKALRSRAALLGIEGAHTLEGELSNLAKLYQVGVRMLGLTHFIDNQFASSAHGIKQAGLTAKGQALVRQSQSLGIVIDLAHSSQATINDVLAISKKPVVVSHTGVKGVCPSPRNLSDEHIKAIAANKGVIGVAIFKGATCGTSINSMLDTVDYLYKLVGVDIIALGLDLDGAVTSPIDVTGLPLITAGLLQRGYSESEIKKIMGLNFIRVLEANLID